MMQQVNLYQPILRRQKTVFSGVTMLQLLGLVSLIMLALFSFNRWQLGELRDERARLQAQEQELAAHVMDVSRNLQARPESRELRRQLETAQREAMLKQRLVDLMDTAPTTTHTGFSEAFAALARQRVEGLWLTAVELDRDSATRNVTLRGLASRAELVPQLVQQLGQEPVFNGLRFRQMRVYRPEPDDGNALAFILSTRLPEEKDR